jgi:hypothetical protein
MTQQWMIQRALRSFLYLEQKQIYCESFQGFTIFLLCSFKKKTFCSIKYIIM